MQYPANQTCCTSNPAVNGWCYTGCGQTLPIVPGSNPALNYWNGQNFLVADGSSQNPISLPNFQTQAGVPTYILGANNNGTWSYYPYAVPSNANSINGGLAGDILYQSAPSVTSFVPAGSVGDILASNGAGQPYWIAPSSVTFGTANNLAGGGAGFVPYQSAAGTTAFVPAGGVGQLLQSNGTSAPSWTSYSLGTMAFQNANSVAITGGTIDGTQIGLTSPVGGTFTNLQVNTKAFIPAIQATNATTGTTFNNSVGTLVAAIGTANGALFNTPVFIGGNVTMQGGGLTLQGNKSAPAWTTNGIRYINIPATMTDTTSSGTVAAAYTNAFNGNTIAATNATTYTKYIGSYFKTPVAGTNVTFGASYALGADSIYSNGNITANGQFSGAGTGLTGTASGLSIGGNATTATTSTNLAGGAAGTIPWQSASGTTGFTAAGTIGQFLTSNGTSAPSWTSVSLGTMASQNANAVAITGGTIDGTQIGLTSAVGGTFSNLQANSKVFTNTIQPISTGNVVINGNTGSAVATVTTSGLSVTGTITGTLSGNASSATNLAGGGVGYIPYQSAAGATAFLNAGTSGQVLTSQGAGSTPTWAAAPTATTANNLAGGAAGELPYQTGSGATSFTAVGTTGQVLTSAGTGAPTWTTATNANTASSIVQRDASGNFSANTITLTTGSNTSSVSGDGASGMLLAQMVAYALILG